MAILIVAEELLKIMEKWAPKAFQKSLVALPVTSLACRHLWAQRFWRRGLSLFDACSHCGLHSLNTSTTPLGHCTHTFSGSRCVFCYIKQKVCWTWLPPPRFQRSEPREPLTHSWGRGLLQLRTTAESPH